MQQFQAKDIRTLRIQSEQMFRILPINFQHGKRNDKTRNMERNDSQNNT